MIAQPPFRLRLPTAGFSLNNSDSENAARWALLLAGGAALGLSFPPFGLSSLAFAALLPLLQAWDRALSWRGALIAAYVFFLATFAVAFSWPLRHALPHVALASLTGVLLLPLWMALPFAAAWPVRLRLGRRIGFAALCGWYLCMEAALSLGPLALPWPLLGHTQAEALALNQFADLTGVPGLSLWVLLLNGTLFAWITRPDLRTRYATALAALLLVALPYGYGLVRLDGLETALPTLRMGLIQPGIAPAAWSDQENSDRIGVLLTLSDSLARSLDKRPDLIIWPETALPLAGPFSRTELIQSQLQRWSDHSQIAILSGAVTSPENAHGRSVLRNSALLLQPGRAAQRYDKQQLVPFAEQAPFSSLIPALHRLTIPAGGVEGYEPGRSSDLLHSGGTRIGTLICLESTFGNLGRRYAAQGANLLVTITQDGWWGRTAGYRQHLAFTRLRAIETRRAVAQVSVSGQTALILPDGSTTTPSAWMQRSAVVVTAPLLETQTFFTRHGPWLNWIALATALSFSLAAAASHTQLLPRQRNPPSVLSVLKADR